MADLLFPFFDIRTIVIAEHPANRSDQVTSARLAMTALDGQWQALPVEKLIPLFRKRLKIQEMQQRHVDSASFRISLAPMLQAKARYRYEVADEREVESPKFLFMISYMLLGYTFERQEKNGGGLLICGEGLQFD